MRLEFFPFILISVLFSLGCSPAHSMPMKPASIVKITTNKEGIQLPLVFATLEKVFDFKSSAGENIIIYSANSSYSECTDSPENGDNLCPKKFLLISIMLDKSGASEFSLFRTSDSLNWVVDDDKYARESGIFPKVIHIYSCEKNSPSEKFHLVAYDLVSANVKQVSLARSNNSSLSESCLVKSKS